MFFYARPPARSRRNASFAPKWPFGLDRTPPVFKNTVFYSGCAHLFNQNRKVIPLSSKTLGLSPAEIYAIYGGCARLSTNALHSRAIWPFWTKSEITRYLQWVRSLLLETLVNSVPISFTFGQMLKSHAIYSGCAHFLQNPRK